MYFIVTVVRFVIILIKFYVCMYVCMYVLTNRCVGSGVVRIDPLHFLAGCRTRRLNQSLSVLSLSLGFF